MHRTAPIASAVVLLIASAGFVSLTGGETQGSDPSLAPNHAAVQRGEYLVKIMGCNDCHTPWKMGPHGPEPDMTRFLSGHPEEIGPLLAVRQPSRTSHRGLAPTPPTADPGV